MQVQVHQLKGVTIIIFLPAHQLQVLVHQAHQIFPIRAIHVKAKKDIIFMVFGIHAIGAEELALNQIIDYL